MAKKNTPPPQPQQSLHELSLTVLDLDLRTIAQNDPDMIHQCLLVQSARRGNNFYHSTIAAANALR